jgi:hypothetical protein
MSRIYGGIHFQEDNIAGQQIGAGVASNVFNNYLLPVPEPSSMLLALGAMLTAGLRRRR